MLTIRLTRGQCHVAGCAVGVTWDHALCDVGGVALLLSRVSDAYAAGCARTDVAAPPGNQAPPLHHDRSLQRHVLDAAAAAAAAAATAAGVGVAPARPLTAHEVQLNRLAELDDLTSQLIAEVGWLGRRAKRARKRTVAALGLAGLALPAVAPVPGAHAGTVRPSKSALTAWGAHRGHARRKEEPAVVEWGYTSAELQRTALSGSISTVLTILSWICVGIHSRRALPSPVCA